MNKKSAKEMLEDFVKLHPGFLTVNLEDIERRVFTRDRQLDDVLKLPRNHPARFALLYASGPNGISKFLKDDNSPRGRQMKNEADIQRFETWQSNDYADRRDTRKAENGSIAYAAMEAGIPAHQPPKVAPQPQRTPTGRIPRNPEMQWWRHRERVETRPLPSMIRNMDFSAIERRVHSFASNYGFGTYKYADFHRQAVASDAYLASVLKRPPGIPEDWVPDFMVHDAVTWGPPKKKRGDKKR